MPKKTFKDISEMRNLKTSFPISVLIAAFLKTYPEIEPYEDQLSFVGARNLPNAMWVEEIASDTGILIGVWCRKRDFSQINFFVETLREKNKTLSSTSPKIR